MIVKKYFPIVFSITVFFFLCFFWNKINLPFDSRDTVIGYYYIHKHHVFNDTLRFLIVISIPTLIYFFTKIYFCSIEQKNIIFFNFENKNFNVDIKLKIFLAIFIAHLILLFLSNKFPQYQLDLFHEGQLLSGGFNFQITKKLWSESFLNTGLFYDILNPFFSWKFTGIQSIGSTRFFLLLLNLVTKIAFLFLIYEISSKSSNDVNKQILIFILCSLFFLLFLKNNSDFRELPLYLFLISISKILTERKKIFHVIFLGFLSIFSLLWSLDIGVYLNLSLIVFLVTLFFSNKKKNIFLIISSAIFFYFIFFLIIGINEFIFFLKNSLQIINEHEKLNGIIHPAPFSSDKNSFRASKIFLIMIVNNLIIINLIFFKNKINFFSNEQKLFFFIFIILSFFKYKTGLSRSDGGHISNGGSFAILAFVFLIVIIIINKFFKKITLKKNFFIFLLTFFLLFFYNNIQFHNLKTFKKRYIWFINLDNSFFINKSYLNFILSLKEDTKNSNCIQLLNYETVIYYLSKIKSCSKYYNFWSLGSKNSQLELIRELKQTENKFLILGSKFDNWNVIPENRFPFLFEYIKSNYSVKKTYGNQKLLEKN